MQKNGNEVVNVEEKDIWDTSFGQDTFSMHNFFQKKGKVPSTDFPLLWKFEVFFLYSAEGDTHIMQSESSKNVGSKRRLLWGWRPYYPHMSEWSAYSNFFHKSGKM